MSRRPTAIVDRFPSADSRGFNILNMFDRASRPTFTESAVESAKSGIESADSGIESADSTADSVKNRPVGMGLHGTRMGLFQRHTLHDARRS